MRKTSRVFRVVGAAALLISMLAATFAPGTAQDDGASQDWLDVLFNADDVGFLDGNNAIYYPWVANDDNFGLGAADTSISVQNLEDSDTTIFHLRRQWRGWLRSGNDSLPLGLRRQDLPRSPAGNC